MTFKEFQEILILYNILYVGIQQALQIGVAPAQLPEPLSEWK